MPTNLRYHADEPARVQPEAEAMKLAFFNNVSTALNMSTFPLMSRTHGWQMVLQKANRWRRI